MATVHVHYWNKSALLGIEFFDRVNQSILKNGYKVKKSPPQVIHVHEDERIIGIKAVKNKRGALFCFQLKVAKLV